MVSVRSVNEIVLNLIDFFKLTQPNLDTKPGTVARDLFIDAPASQISLLYDELEGVSNSQSLRVVVGSDLDKLAKNFAVARRQSNKASGVAIFTFSSIDSPISINKGDIVIGSNGLTFIVSNGISLVPASINYYKSIASKYRDQLNMVGIKDTLALEVTVLASVSGISGNIGKYTINRTNVPGVSNVTNVVSFTGGSNQETDALFRNRVLATFSGSSVGTVLGYQNVALSTSGVIDASVIEPGSPLMTRDGTEVTTNADGSKTVINEGSGGKVDIIILGNSLQQTTDSFIYKDKSNNNNTTSVKNNYVLGQITGDENKTINRKRIDNIANGELPQQPVSNIVQVIGSISGANFVEKTIDSFGRTSGNYELIKDTGVYNGSCWGFDTFHWISNKISLFQDEKIKGKFNGQDQATFTGVLEIPNVQQFISITNEDSQVTSDRSIIKLLHSPASNVVRVFNVNTGERYIVINQNVDSTGSLNTTGRIKISGNTLPIQSDVLQVDYNWIVNYDQYSDYDGLSGTSNIRPAVDSIDWGYSSLVKNEYVNFSLDDTNNFFVGTASHPISTVVAANKFSQIDAIVTKITSGIFVNRLAVVIYNLPTMVNTVESIKNKNTNIEQYATTQNIDAQNIINISGVVGINIIYNTTVILPTDASAVEGDKLTVIFNSIDTYHQNNSVGNSSGTEINIPASQVDSLATEITLLVSYIANTPELYSSAILALPSSKSGNGYLVSNNNGFNNFSIANLFARESQTVQKNTSNEFYVNLTLSSTDYTLMSTKVTSIIRLSDGLELWNADNLGDVITGGTGNYQLILTGYNAPAISDKVLVIYSATDLIRTQPFTYHNNIIKYNLNNISYDPIIRKFTLPLSKFTSQTQVSFSIIEPNSNIELYTVIDGHLIGDGHSALIGSDSIDFMPTYDLLNKKVKISNANNYNNGIFDIIGYDTLTNTIRISSCLDKIDFNQISIIRLLDSKEIWNESGSIDIANNRLILPGNVSVLNNDRALSIIFNYSNLKQSSPRIISNITDQTVNAGTITVSGTTITKAADVVFTATNTGLKLNLSEAVRKALNLNSIAKIPSNIRLARIAKLEKVITASTTNDEVLSVSTTYDLKNTIIKNNLFYIDDFLFNPTLQNLDFILPSTQNNTLNSEMINLPIIGDKLRVTFYFVVENDLENLSYTRNGILYTNKKFALIDRIFVNSGFKSSLSTRLSFTALTQPNPGVRYRAFYDYLAPKQNERISINYTFNKLISDATFNVEQARTINADVIVKAAGPILVNLTMNVVILDTSTLSTTTILQNLKGKLISAINSITLGNIIDQATLINMAQGISGIARARVLYLNKNGKIGSALSLKAQNDEYFISNNIIVNIETR